MTEQEKTAEDEQLEALLSQMEQDGLRTTDEFDVTWAPTGIASLDQSLGSASGGGFPRQRISILQGEEHSGKTLISLAAIAHCQRNNGRAAFIDAEHALTPDFARLLGVDFEALVVDRPKTLGKAYDILRAYGRSGLFDIIVWDSVTALVPESELDAPAADSQQRASIPQMHSKELPKIQATLSKRTAVILLNQLRENPNPPAWSRGKVLYAPGGKALRHSSSLTVMVKPGQVHKHGEQRVGQRIRTEAIKNKVAVPFRKAEFDLMYNTGIDLLTSLLDTAIEYEIVKKRSSFFYMDVVDFENGLVLEEKRFAGRASIEQYLRDNPNALDNLSKQLAAREADET